MIRAQKQALRACQIGPEAGQWRPDGTGPIANIDAELESEATAAAVQRWTFIVSLVVQVGVLIFSWVSITSNDVPYLLLVVMLLEAIVQTIEFSAYLIMGLVAWFTHTSVGVEWRYLDWVVTTPTMLISLYMLQVYFWEPCPVESYNGEKFVERYLPWVPIIIVFNWAMLATGFVGEYDTSRAVKRLGRLLAAQLSHGTHAANSPAGFPEPILTSLSWFPVLLFAYLNPLSWVVAFGLDCGGFIKTDKRNQSLAGQSVSTRRWYLGLGFFFLIGALLVHFVSMAALPTTEGAVLTILTLVVWALYGVVALWLTPRDAIFEANDHQQMGTYLRATTTLMWKNACYNILDLISKNSTGIFVSIVAVNYDSSKGVCAS